MKKELLIKHIKGQTNANEAQEVINWIDKSQANEDYYTSLLNAIAIVDISEETTLHNKETEIIKAKENTKNNIERHIKNLYFNKKRFFHIITIAIAACILLFVSIGVNIYQYSDNKRNTSTSIALAEPITNVINTYYTNSGVKGRIILPDSSIVWLNSCSQITYPSKFATGHREIEFEGEGYFEVKKNPNSPMIVKTPKGMKIKVLGTKFMIKSYTDDNYEEATLISGKITISNSLDNKAKGIETEMNPGETISFGKKLKQTHSYNVDTLKRSAWKRGELLFEQMPLKEVCKILERWHGVKIVVLDKSLYSYTFTAEFGSESMTQIMELMKFTMPISYTINDNTIKIQKKELH